MASLLDEDFTLTHLSGRRQSKEDWPADVGSGEVRYHSSKEQSVTVQLQGDEASLVGRNLVDALMEGSRQIRNLQFSVDYVRRHDEWVATRAVVTQF